jgi:hypothetical protein
MVRRRERNSLSANGNCLCKPNSARVSGMMWVEHEMGAYRHVVAVHEGEAFGVRIEPTLGTVGIGVRIENSRVAMSYPCVYADDRLNCIDATYQLLFRTSRTLGHFCSLLLTPGGKNCPAIVTPCSGTTLHSGNPVAGNILWPSLRTA